MWRRVEAWAACWQALPTPLSLSLPCWASPTHRCPSKPGSWDFTAKKLGLLHVHQRLLSLPSPADLLQGRSRIKKY